MRREFTLSTFPNSEVERFWSTVDRSGGPNACWEWQGRRDPHGYGRFCSQRRTWRANRLALAFGKGEYDSNLDACHSCDNPPCCNPAHLWAGTNAQNRADSKAKGRTPSGDRHGMALHPESRCIGEKNAGAVLTEGQVVAIRLARQQGKAIRALAREYGVHQRTIQRVVKGTHWRHLAVEVRT